MTSSFLAAPTMGGTEIFIILITLALPITFLAWILKTIVKHRNENIKLRLEVGKLADELEKIRKKIIVKFR